MEVSQNGDKTIIEGQYNNGDMNNRDKNNGDKTMMGTLFMAKFLT